MLYFEADRNDVEVSELNVELDSSQFDESLADQMFNKVRIVCLVMTHPENHKTKAIHVKNTWGRKCNKLLFMSSANDSVLNTIVLPVEDGREFLWKKTKSSFLYAHKNHFDDADWFLKTDDDS